LVFELHDHVDALGADRYKIGRFFGLTARFWARFVVLLLAGANLTQVENQIVAIYGIGNLERLIHLAAAAAEYFQQTGPRQNFFHAERATRIDLKGRGDSVAHIMTAFRSEAVAARKTHFALCDLWPKLIR
jgi:hypothetical protein